MLRTSCSAIALLILTGPTFAEDIDATSQVTAAIVYPQGALVTRSVRFSAPAGDNQIIIDDLPFDFDTASLRVAGEGNAAFSIVSVDHRIDRLPPVADEDNPLKTRIEGEIEALEAQLRAIETENRLFQADIEAAQTRQRFAGMLMAREPQMMVDDVEYQRAGPETWVQAIGLLTSETGAALRTIVLTEEKIATNLRKAEDLQEDLYKKQEELNATVLPPPERSIATVELTSSVPIEGTLQITYQVANAGWEPVYDLRLDQGEAAVLLVERHARVSQYTGEDWSDVALMLSTARPSGRMDAPELGSVQAVLYDPGNAATSMLGDLDKFPNAMAPEPEAPAELNAAQEAILGGADAGGEVFGAGLVNAVAQLQGQTVVFQLPAAADVAGDGTVRQLAIDSGKLKAGLLARATPEFDPSAYLYAAVTNSFSGPLLPGRASVFRDGTFVGETNLPLVVAGKEVVLPFGVLDGLSVTRHVLEKTDGDFGLIGTTNQRVERFKLSVESVLTYSIPVTLYDRIPFSEQEDLEITTYANPEPSVVDLEGKRGVRNWTFVLPAGGKQVVEFGYDIRWPGESAMVVQ
ncbi:mucoidy inhibitor MuiA family protein [Tabrizicola sp.]|uniref:mucoidy inhibitor MuiA family protein n=1 Tax=Tabrizicola sp. TaxID=2005166 RepID=UPI003F2DD23B